MKFKTIAKISLLLFTGFIICLLSIGPLRSQISEVAGLAVAQTHLRWNDVKDAALGDDLTNGILVSAPYLFDGANWDRPLKSTHGDNLTTGYGQNMASFLYGYDSVGGNWDRIHMDPSGSINVNIPSGITFPTQALTTLLNAVTGTGAGASNNMTYLLSKHSWQAVIAGGTLTTLSVNFEGSIDNINWFVLDTSTAVGGEMRHIVNKPVQYIRGNVTAWVVAVGTPALTVKCMDGGN